MKRYILYIIGLIIVFSCAKDIIDLTGSVEGFVKDEETNECLQGVSITLSPSGKTTTTGSDGRYSFIDLDANNYSIEFAKLGYETNKKEITILSGKRAPLDIMLKKISNALMVTPEVLNFGELETSKTIFLSCLEGLGSIKYSIKTNADWISLSKSEGNATSSGDKITIVIDRGKLSIGNYEKNIIISSIYGEVIIPIVVNQVEHDKATVTIDSPNNITETSLTIKGTIIKTGGLKITSHGHCWAETEQPTIDNNKNNLGDTETIGDFTSTLTNLTAGKTYYIRAYAVNSKGVAYSEQVSVTLPIISKPTVATRDISNLKKDSVCLNGVIIDKGNGNINEIGFYWGLTEKTENKQIVRTVIDSTFSYILKSLQADKTYFYKAYAINEKGESLGKIKSFTSFDKNYIEGAPTVYTENATEITTDRATLKGFILDPGDNEIIQRGFYYGESENTMIKKTANVKDDIFTLNITGLKDETTYYFKAFAINDKGESFGKTKTFITKEVSMPVVLTSDATRIKTNCATLNGIIVNQEDCEISKCGFYYGESVNAMVKKESNITDSIISLDVTNLTDGTTYYYKVFATNQKGESCGDIKEFTTKAAKAPEVQTLGATDINIESATLNGEIISNGDYEITQRGFYFGKSKDDMTKRIVSNTDNNISLNVTNLADGTTYYYKVFATNQKGESCGDIKEFTTKAAKAPEVLTGDAESISFESVVLNGEIIDKGTYDITQRGFYFGKSENSMSKKYVNTNDTRFNLSISDLNDGTKYYYKAFALSKKGESLGDVKVFTTLTPKEPNVQTNNATNISYEKATLNGVVLDEGTYNVTEYGFYFGTNQNPTVKYQVGNSYNTSVFYKSIANLNDNTTYYYKAYAKNSVGYSFGEVKRFTTMMKPKISIIDYSFSKNKQSPTSRCDIRIEAEIEVNDATIIEQGILSGRSGSNSEISLNSYYSKVQCEIINNRIVGVIDGSKHISYGSYNPIRAYIICDDGTIFYSEQIIAYIPKYSDL